MFARCSSATRARCSGVVTRKTLVREVVAAGRDPATTLLGAIAEPPIFTLDADENLDVAFHELEERDLERVPVTESGRLVGHPLPGRSCSAGWQRTSRRSTRRGLTQQQV